MIEEKKVLYDHTSDKRGSKWSSSISLKKIPDTELPEFIVENRNKYKNWLD